MVAALEPIIDDITARYDPPQEFVLPGENRVAAALDLARCVVRRAERASVAATRDGWLDPATSHVVPYLNRLADLVYTLARWQEGVWRPVRTDRPPDRSQGAPLMPITATLSTPAPAKVTADVLAVPVFAGRVLGPGGKALDTAIGGSLDAVHDRSRASRARRKRPWPSRPASSAPRAALLVGLGDKKTVSVDRLRRAAAAVVRRSPKAKTVATTLLDAVPAGGDRVAAAQALAEGAALGAYKFLRYKQKSDAPALERFVVLGKKDAAVQAGLDRGMAVAGAVAWARDLVNEPAGAMTPTQLAEEARRAAEQGGLDIEVLDEVEIANQGLGGLLGVSLGSDQPPRLVKLTYTPQGQGHRHRRPRRQGHHLRLRRPVAQDRRRHGDDEDRHVGGGGGHRGDVGAADAPGCRRRSSPSCPPPRTCPAGGPSSPATSSRSATGRRSRSSTPTPRAG